MGAPQNHSSFRCELRIIQAKNIEFVSTGNVFVRYYLVSETNRKIRLTSREIHSTCNPCWNESSTLECLGAQNAMDTLRRQNVVFELRWRKESRVFGKFGHSKLLVRAQVGWKDVLDSSELSIETWVTSPVTSKYVPEGVKPPALQISMKVQDPKMSNTPKRKHVRSTEWKECGCGHCVCNGRDDDIYALAAINGL